MRGGAADEGLLEFYDASRALAGFQRSLALTTHLVLHGEIITQATAAHGFVIYVPPFIEGSWKAKAKIAIIGAFAVGSVGKDSPVGHAVTSAYDYVLNSTMGFHVDYDKTLQQQYFEANRQDVTEAKLDSLCEKVEASIADMHRPIVISKSANRGQVSRCGNRDERPIGPLLNTLTYDYVKQTKREDETQDVVGYVSSYNINTFKGRVYSIDEQRPIPFELDEKARDKATVAILTRSQHINGQAPFDDRAMVSLTCQRLVSASGKVKRYMVLSAAEGVGRI